MEKKHFFIVIFFFIFFIHMVFVCENVCHWNKKKQLRIIITIIIQIKKIINEKGQIKLKTNKFMRKKLKKR